MSEIMTREKVWKTAEQVGLAGEVGRLLTLAEDALRLDPVEETTATVSFRLSVGATSTTVFRLGSDYEGSRELGISFPFYTWSIPSNRVLELLRRQLLEGQPRLDKGGAEQDVRLAITKTNVDDLIAAVCTIYGEVRRELRLRER